MKLYFGGSEIKAWRELLKTQAVPSVSLSYVGLTRRIKNTGQWRIADNYSGQAVFLDSGGHTYNKDEADFTHEDAVQLAHDYMGFVSENIHSVSLVSEFDARQLGNDLLLKMREDFYDGLPPDKFMPIWHTEYGTDELERLCSEYSVVGVCQSDMYDTSLIPVLNSCVNRYGTRLHGVAITSKDMMRSVAWDSVSSLSWLSPSIFGDTIVWTGRELKRYPRAYKNNARKKHRTLFTDNGFDYQKIEADDSTELLKLSLWSWQKFTDSLDGVTHHLVNEKHVSADSPGTTVDTHTPSTGNENRVPAIREVRETVILPVMGTISKSVTDDEGVSDSVPFVITRSESMRACNTCFLRDKCPGFKPDANCLYNIPIEVKTRDQLRALQDALVEMQGHRVMFMKMAEDIEGGYADPNLSNEMDRLQRMIKTKIENERDKFSMVIEATQSNKGPGFMEKLLGQDAVGKLRQLDAPMSADEIIKDSEIVDAELVNEH